MANTWIEHVHHDGSRILQVDFHGTADASGDESKMVLLDMANYPVEGMTLKYYKITHLEYTLTTGSAFELYHEGSNDEPAFFSSSNEHARLAWVNRPEHNRDVPGATGRILVTTQGFDAAVDRIYLSLVMAKYYKPTVAGDHYLSTGQKRNAPGGSHYSTPSGT
jgi:hypothetical protein